MGTPTKESAKAEIKRGFEEKKPLNISRKKNNDEFKVYKGAFFEMIEELKGQPDRISELSRYGASFAIQG